MIKCPFMCWTKAVQRTKLVWQYSKLNNHSKFSLKLRGQSPYIGLCLRVICSMTSKWQFSNLNWNIESDSIKLNQGVKAEHFSFRSRFENEHQIIHLLYAELKKIVNLASQVLEAFWKSGELWTNKLYLPQFTHFSDHFLHFCKSSVFGAFSALLQFTHSSLESRV